MLGAIGILEDDSLGGVLDGAGMMAMGGASFLSRPSYEREVHVHRLQTAMRNGAVSCCEPSSMAQAGAADDAFSCGEPSHPK